jgi:hypothetical protein
MLSILDKMKRIKKKYLSIKPHPSLNQDSFSSSLTWIVKDDLIRNTYQVDWSFKPNYSEKINHTLSTTPVIYNYIQ